jgi:hypothetical protein
MVHGRTYRCVATAGAPQHCMRVIEMVKPQPTTEKQAELLSACAVASRFYSFAARELNRAQRLGDKIGFDEILRLSRDAKSRYMDANARLREHMRRGDATVVSIDLPPVA